MYNKKGKLITISNFYVLSDFYTNKTFCDFVILLMMSHLVKSVKILVSYYLITLFSYIIYSKQ